MVRIGEKLNDVFNADCGIEFVHQLRRTEVLLQLCLFKV
jgi:hypothetical protein